MTDTHATRVLGKGHIQDPMPLIFTAPMSPDGLAEAFGRERGTEPVLAGFGFGKARAGGHDAAQGV